MEFIEKMTENADEIQTRVLAEILSRNSNVEYLKRHGLNGRTDTEAFKKIVPVVSYEDIQPDIKRIANGDSSPILCCEPISEFLTSSGTSGGERKLVPMTGEELRRRASFNNLSTPVLTQCFPGIDRGKAMYFLFVASESKTPSGLLARQAITYTFIPTMAYFEFLPLNENKGRRDDFTDSTSVPTKSFNGEEKL